MARGVSSTPPYEKGRSFEYLVKRHLEREGYRVFRVAGSRGPSDLVAARRGELLLVQCRTRGYLPPKRRERLRMLAEEVGARAIIAQRKGRKLNLEEI